LLNGYLQSLEDAPSKSFKPFRLRRSTHTSYPNKLLKNSYALHSGETAHSTPHNEGVKRQFSICCNRMIRQHRPGGRGRNHTRRGGKVNF
jgi:hypothetical protein